MVRIAAVVSALALSSPAAAQEAMPADELRPALDARGYLTVNASETLDHGEMSFGLGSLAWGHRLMTEDDNLVSATLVGALGLHAGPLPLQLGVSLPFTVIDGAQQMDAQDVGDLTLHGKARIAHAGPIGLAAIASVDVPTGTVRLAGAVDVTFDRFRLALNGGTTSLGAAAAFSLAPRRVEVIGEVFGSPSSLEALGGLKVYLAKSSYMMLGAGRGLMTDRPGNPDFRGVIGIVFEPRPARRAAQQLGSDDDERVAAGPPVPRDSGGADSDNDGIKDRDDKCPEVMEDYDAVDDEDGCPEAEDTPRDLVIEKEAELVTLRPIEFEFDSDVLRDSAYPILDAVVKALVDNPEIALVEVQGHTDEQGSDAYNLDLSIRRAAAVKRYLIEEGIADARLTSVGKGEREPVDPAHTAAAYAINRRVAFLIRARQ